MFHRSSCAWKRLEQRAGDTELAEALNTRLDGLSAGNLWDTERAVQQVLANDTEGALDALDALSQRGLLNLPALAGYGMAAGGFNLYPETVALPRFIGAVANQTMLNKRLAHRIRAEAPQILMPQRS